MFDLIKIVIVLTILSTTSGGVLAYLNNATKDQIATQQFKFDKEPAIKAILGGSSSGDSIDKFSLKIDDKDKSFYVGKMNGKANTVVFESLGKGGYGGNIGLMVGINVETGKIIGAAVTTHSETPGLGAKAKTDPAFVSQFKDRTLEAGFKVTNDGGKLNAISGATITSRAVCNAATNIGKIYTELKPEIAEKVKGFN